MDFGVKGNILRAFAKRNCDVTVFPATTRPEEVLGINPDLIFLSNGPGDPEDLRRCYRKYKRFSWQKADCWNMFRTSITSFNVRWKDI